MKAVRIHEHGSIDVLKWEEVSIPGISENQVLVEIKAAAMNHLDLWVRKGIPGVSLPCILGSDGSGTVKEMGSKVTSFKTGDEVLIQPLTYCRECRFCKHGLENYCESWGIYGENQNGTQCEFMVVDEDHLRSKPHHLSFEEAAGFPLVAQTAYTMLVRRAKIKQGETVFIWGAGSGVGSIAIQIAKEKGCLVIAAGGSEEKLNLARELGADKVLNYKLVDVKEEVNRVTDGGGVDVIFEHVGAKTWDTSLKILGKGGRLVTCGATTGARVEIDIRHLFYKQQSIMGSTMGDVAAFDEVLQLLEEKKIRPVIDKVFPMKNIRDAHVYLEESHQAGKVIIVP